MRSVPSAPLVGPFAERLLAADLPGLEPEHLRRTVDFIARRVDGLPSLMRIGVVLIAALVRAALALPVSDAVVRAMSTTTLPLLGEYPRLVRSLGYAFIWETWPDSTADGAAA